MGLDMRIRPDYNFTISSSLDNGIVMEMDTIPQDDLPSLPVLIYQYPIAYVAVFTVYELGMINRCIVRDKPPRG